MPDAGGAALYLNPNADASRSDHWGALSKKGSDEAIEEISRWSGYQATPLYDLRGHADRLGIAALHYKDESSRFGLGSFKSLGGAYAVFRLLQSRLADLVPGGVSAADLESGRHEAETSKLTVCCATDGNHGRSVAWGAQKFHCRCVIYLHEHVSAGREAAIARYGAEIVRTPGGYDDSVRKAAKDAQKNGWTVVSDTSWAGYETIPLEVMHGYTLMLEEVLDRLPTPPTHMFVQAGVGGVAAAVCARAASKWRNPRPMFVVVEPERAACLYESARHGRCARVDIREETVMACLSAGEPSPLAWSVLRTGADAFMTLSERCAPEAMRRLASDGDGDPAIVAGESGAAGFAGLQAACADEALAGALGLDAGSRVLVFGTEGATDAEIYRRLVGRSPEDVAGTGA